VFLATIELAMLTVPPLVLPIPPEAFAPAVFPVTVLLFTVNVIPEDRFIMPPSPLAPVVVLPLTVLFVSVMFDPLPELAMPPA